IPVTHPCVTTMGPDCGHGAVVKGMGNDSAVDNGGSACCHARRRQRQGPLWISLFPPRAGGPGAERCVSSPGPHSLPTHASWATTIEAALDTEDEGDTAHCTQGPTRQVYRP